MCRTRRSAALCSIRTRELAASAKAVNVLTSLRHSTNYFAEVEQIGFDPSQMPPGLEPTEDPVLQARMFSYGDAERYGYPEHRRHTADMCERYRIGVNHKQLPINCPLNPVGKYSRQVPLRVFT
jgi:catalase